MVYIILAIMYIIGIILYWTFSSGTLQEWAKIPTVKKEETLSNDSKSNSLSNTYGRAPQIISDLK